MGISITESIVSILGGLFQSLVGNHVILDRNQDILNRGRILPGFQQTQVFHFSIGLVHTGNIDLVAEVDDGRLFWIFGSAHQLQTIDSVLKVGLKSCGAYFVGTQNGAIPVCKGHVVGYVQKVIPWASP